MINNCSTLDTILIEVKQELRNLFVRRKDLIIRLGNEFQDVVSDAESICEEIKNALHEEIVEGVISNRDIERYCPDKWKKKTKPKKEKNDNLSFSRQEQEQIIPQLVAGANGNSVTGPASIPSPNSNNGVVTCERSTKEQVKCIDECPVRVTSADKQLSSQQYKVKELETKIERLELEMKSKLAENHVLRMRVQDLKLRVEHNVHSQISEIRFFDVQFRVSFEDLRRYISSCFSKNNEVDNIIFAATVDVANKKLLDIQIG